MGEFFFLVHVEIGLGCCMFAPLRRSCEPKALSLASSHRRGNQRDNLQQRLLGSRKYPLRDERKTFRGGPFLSFSLFPLFLYVLRDFFSFSRFSLFLSLASTGGGQMLLERDMIDRFVPKKKPQPSLSLT